jgi:hypothetical protein
VTLRDPNAAPRTQLERVVAAAKRFNGVTQVDFLAPDVVDGGLPITRLAARLWEADQAGYRFECIGRRQRCKVWRLIEDDDVERTAGSTPDHDPPVARVSTDSPSQESLFDVPSQPHWRAA